MGRILGIDLGTTNCCMAVFEGGQPTVIPGSPPVPALIQHRGIEIHRTWSTRFRKTSAAGKLANLATFFLSATWRVWSAA